MQVNREKIKELLQTDFLGNNARFAKALDVDPGHLYNFINNGIGGGKKVVGAVYRYCVQNGLEVEKYIEM